MHPVISQHPPLDTRFAQNLKLESTTQLLVFRPVEFDRVERVELETQQPSPTVQAPRCGGRGRRRHPAGSFQGVKFHFQLHSNRPTDFGVPDSSFLLYKQQARALLLKIVYRADFFGVFSVFVCFRMRLKLRTKLQFSMKVMEYLEIVDYFSWIFVIFR